MHDTKWITAQDLHRWAQSPQGKLLLPELLRRLVFATVSSQDLKHLDFPSEGEIHRPYYDGVTNSSVSTPFVPQGTAYWELGCEVGKCKGKAQRDYDNRIREHNKRVADGEADQIHEATFIAVTALNWPSRAKWVRARSNDNLFAGVRAYDSNDIEHWLYQAPATALWLAEKIHGRRDGLVSLKEHWEDVLATLQESLPAKILLVNRENACSAFSDWLNKPAGELAIKAHSREEVVCAFCAWVETLEAKEQERIASRAVVVENRDTWKALATSQQRLTLIAAARLDDDSELYATATRKGHHVLRYASFRTPRSEDVIELARMHRSDLEKALVEGGVPEIQSAKLAESAGGSFTILRRRFGKTTDDKTPQWAQQSDLVPMLLAAAWNDRVDGDQTILAALASPNSYADVQNVMHRWRQQTDAPVRLITGTWEFLSPLDAWEALFPLITGTHLRAFQAAAIEVLSEEDPKLDLPPEQRWMAGVKGKVLRYSGALRSGLAEVLALGASRENEDGFGQSLHFSALAASIVARILPPHCSWKRWASIGEKLTLLMEAAPETLLSIMEADLASSESQLVELFHQEKPDGMAGTIYHSGLLWALECVSWSREYFQRAALILARLSKRDPGGKWSNRPKASASRIFLSWSPQTTAPLAERLAALKYLCLKEPEGCWQIILQLMPALYESSFNSMRPTYRDWASGWTEDVTGADYRASLDQLAAITAELCEAAPERWKQILQHLARLPKQGFDSLVDSLDKQVAGGLDEDLRNHLWAGLSALTKQHRHFHDADWVLPEEDIQRLEAICAKVAPSDAAILLTPLFDENDVVDGNKELSYEQKMERRDGQRREAIRKLWKNDDWASILRLVKKVRDPWRLGVATGAALEDSPLTLILPSMLDGEDRNLHEFACGYTVQRISQKGCSWAKELVTADWSPGQIAALGLRMPSEPTAWDWIAEHREVVENLYWRNLEGWQVCVAAWAEAKRAIEKFLAVERPWAALQLLGSRLYDDQEVSGSLVCDTLEAILTATTPPPENADMAHRLYKAFGYLQDDSTVDEARVAKLEFAFIPLLGVHTKLPKVLHRILARDAKFFVDCLAMMFKRRSESKLEDESQSGAVDSDSEPIGEAKVSNAERAGRLLHDWRLLPGTTPEGGVDVDELRRWVTDARRLARSEDRIEVCDSMVGQLFAHSPLGKDGGLPAEAVRQVIEECESAEMENGFGTGLINSRGGHFRGLRDGGKQERELASRYEGYAEKCKTWPRTAGVLRGLAKWYLRCAELEDEKVQARD